MKEFIGSQGEVNIFKIDKMPKDMKAQPLKRGKTGYVIAHSENGNHHVLTGGADAEVMERTDNVPTGMRIIYAALKDPHNLVQDAPVPHEGFHGLKGLYEFRISREFNPFTEQTRRVVD